MTTRATKPNRRVRIIVACVLVAAIAAIAVSCVFGGGLISMSHHVGHLDDWANAGATGPDFIGNGFHTGGGKSYGSQGPQWISNDTLIYLGLKMRSDHYEFIQLDAATGRHDPLSVLDSALTDQLSRYKDRPIGLGTLYSPPSFAVSPDGKTIAIAPASNPKTPHFEVEDLTCDLGGKVQDMWRRRKLNWYPGYERIIWLDSNHWVDLEHNSIVPLPVCSVSDTRNPHAPQRITHVPITRWLPSEGPCGNRIWGIMYTSSRPGLIDTIDWDILADQPPQHVFIKPPWNGVAASAAPNRERNTVVWLVWYQHFSPLLQIAQKLGFAKDTLPSQYLAVWISKPDGSKMEEIAHDIVPKGVQWAGDIQWLPDGKSVSYCLDDDVYTLRVRK